MSRSFLDRRTHGSIAELTNTKRLVFHDCADCGKRVYTHNSKRCPSCAHTKKISRAREAARRTIETKKARKLRGYRDMLAILGIREHDGDCI